MTTSQIKLFLPSTPDIQRGQLKSCEVCGTKFSVFVAEHQCKRCLRAVCSGCAGAKRDVYKPKMIRSQHRLCKHCNLQSTILVEYIKANKLRFGIDSQLARKWYGKIPKKTNQLTSFKQYRKFSIETFNQLWDSYNFSFRQFIGLLTYEQNQGDIYMLVNNVYTQLQSRAIDQKLQNIIMIIVFMLCYSAPDLCTDLVQYLYNLKKTVADQKQILQLYLRTLSIEQPQQKKLNDYINYKFKQYVGPFSIGSVSAECSIHVVTRAFQKQRVDQLYILLAIILQNNWVSLLADKSKGNLWCNFLILRNCNMSTYIGKFKILNAVNINQYINKNGSQTEQKGGTAQKQREQTVFIDKQKFMEGRESKKYENLFSSFTSGIKLPQIKLQPQQQTERQRNFTPPKPDYSNRNTLMNRQSLEGDFIYGYKNMEKDKEDESNQRGKEQKEKKPKYILKQEEKLSQQSLDEQQIREFELMNKGSRKQQKMTNIVTGFRQSVSSINSYENSLDNFNYEKQMKNSNVSVDIEQLNFNKSQSESSIVYNQNFSYGSNKKTTQSITNSNRKVESITTIVNENEYNNVTRAKSTTITKDINSNTNTDKQITNNINENINMARKQSLLTLNIQKKGQSEYLAHNQAQPNSYNSNSTNSKEKQTTQSPYQSQMRTQFQPSTSNQPLQTQIQQLQLKLTQKSEELEKATKINKSTQSQIGQLRQQIKKLKKKQQEDYRIQLQSQQIYQTKIQQQLQTQFQQKQLILQKQMQKKLEEERLRLQTQMQQKTMQLQQNQIQAQGQTQSTQQVFVQQIQQQLQISQQTQKKNLQQIQQLQAQLQKQKLKSSQLTTSLKQAQAKISLSSAMGATNNSGATAKVGMMQQQMKNMTKKNQEQEQKLINATKQMYRYQKQNIGYKNQIDQLKMTNRLLKQKLQEGSSLGFNVSSSKSQQNQQQLSKMNQLMRKTIQNKNKQLQNLHKKNKELSIQIQEQAIASKNGSNNALNIQIGTREKNTKSSSTSKISQSQADKIRQLQRQKEQLIQKMKQLGDKILKQQQQKLNLSSQLFQFKVEVQKQRSQSMILPTNITFDSQKRSSVFVGQTQIQVQNKTEANNENQKGHECIIF